MTKIEVLGSTFTDEASALVALREEVIRLEAEQVKKRQVRLQSLASELGLSSIDELIKDLAEFASPALRRTIQGDGANSGVGVARGKRARVTPELKQAILIDIKAGKTSKVVAATHGVSIPTVQGIKKEAGLVKARTKSLEKPE